MPLIPMKTSPGAQNMKTGPDALGTTENESGSAKHENGPDALIAFELWIVQGHAHVQL
jgi:hypothetical protein